VRFIGNRNQKEIAKKKIKFNTSHAILPMYPDSPIIEQAAVMGAKRASITLPRFLVPNFISQRHCANAIFGYVPW